MMQRFSAIGLVLFAMAAMAPSAVAQLSREGGAIEIIADMNEIDDVRHQAIYFGDVDVTQGDARLRADKVIVNYQGRDETPQPASGSRITTIQAQGNVFYVTSRGEKVRANEGVYDAASESITLTGDVHVTNPDGVVAGQNLVINIPSGRYTMDGGEGGRVRTVFDQIATEEPIQ